MVTWSSYVQTADMIAWTWNMTSSAVLTTYFYLSLNGNNLAPQNKIMYLFRPQEFVIVGPFSLFVISSYYLHQLISCLSVN